LVVDDSPLCRDLLAQLLGADPRLEVVGLAVDGEDAVRQVHELRPDLVTMDLRMPVMDGIESTRRIMAERPTPILVLTGHPFQAGRDVTFDAIRAGALDLMVKPDLGDPVALDKLRGDLSRLIRFLATVEVREHPRRLQPAADAPPLELPRRDLSVVAVAASAGGPGAVHRLLSGLPGGFPAGVVVVQHLAEGFDAEFAKWLDAEVELPVRLARHDDEVLPGRVLVAPSGAHLRLMGGGTCKLIPGAPLGGYRPSADVLLSSAARVHGEAACGVILSGMGQDGVAGLEEIRRRGGLTIAQDETSCVVFGMPGAAVERGVVDAVLPLDRIAPALVRVCGLDHAAEGA
jgi:two-component system chemotaxis response regulator CheB